MRSRLVAVSVDESTLHDEPGDLRAAEMPEYALFVLASSEPAAVGRRLPIGRIEACLLGRSVERGGYSIADLRMSRVHARVSWDARCGAFRVADLESQNGVWVDGQRVDVAQLRAGSVLRMGATLLVLVAGDPMSSLRQRAERAARSKFTVLIHGESGVGKEHLARTLHTASGRSGEFVAVNCSAFARDLLAAELFGHTRGAFSGATAPRAGLFRAADAGTLFLDEIGDMPLELQPMLLRVLQEGCVRPVGHDREVPVDVRVIAASHHDFEALLATGRFRVDLHARLAQVELEVPPLRERTEQLPQLIATLADQLGIAVSVELEAMTALAAHSWPENVRELQNLLTRLKLFGDAPYVLDLALLEREAPKIARRAHQPASGSAASPNSEVPAGYTRSELVAALERHSGKVAELARELGTSRTQVYRWLKRWGIEPPTRKG